MARTPQELRDDAQVALQDALARDCGQFTSWDDGWFSAPDVPGVRLRVIAESPIAPPAPSLFDLLPAVKE